MSGDLSTLSVFSPLPPEENGIADYTYHLLRPLSELFECNVYTSDLQADAPANVAVYDADQAYRYIREGHKLLHQIGNNPGHIFVLNALRTWGGVTTLHDQNLHYLYEVSGETPIALSRHMTAVARELGTTFASHWFDEDVKTRANYVLFDMLHETLTASSAVVVHSRFARTRLVTLYGRQLASHVAIIPHLALPFMVDQRKSVLDQVGVSQGQVLIVTAGFATFAKRFDWLVEALNEVANRGTDFFWVHAGKERLEEYNLSGLISKYPAVKQRSLITGYLDEGDLNAFIGASDVLVNLRFPSVGESSGSLARAMSVAKCCIVSETAAYAELPRGTVVQIPLANPVRYLADVLDALLTNPEARAAIGNAARRYSLSTTAPEQVAKAYKNVIEAVESRPLRPRSAQQSAANVHTVFVDLSAASMQRPVAVPPGIASGDWLEIIFKASSLSDLARLTLVSPDLIPKLLPPAFRTLLFRIERTGTSDKCALRFRGLL